MISNHVTGQQKYLCKPFVAGDDILIYYMYELNVCVSIYFEIFK